MNVQLPLLPTLDCECEHGCHWHDPLVHAYAQVVSERIIQTPYGRMAVCEQCANTCWRQYLPEYQ